MASEQDVIAAFDRTFVESSAVDRLIRFDSAADYQNRPQFRELLDPEADKPLQIIGGYGFDKNNYVTCGFSGCKTPHGHGFVIRNAAGFETNIGNCCGKTRLGAEWNAMYTKFQAQKHLEALFDVLKTVLESRESKLQRAMHAHAMVESAQKLIEPILQEIRENKILAKEFFDCIRNGGALTYYRSLTSDERSLSGGQTTVRETMGRLEGIEVAGGSPNTKLRFKVIIPLQEANPDHLKSLKAKKLEEKLKQFNAMDEIIYSAESYSKAAERFLQPKNWDLFEKYCDNSKVRMTGQAYRILRRLARTL